MSFKDTQPFIKASMKLQSLEVQAFLLLIYHDLAHTTFLHALSLIISTIRDPAVYN